MEVIYIVYIPLILQNNGVLQTAFDNNFLNLKFFIDLSYFKQLKKLIEKLIENLVKQNYQFFYSSYKDLK